MKFPRKTFDRFCSNLIIESKEKGLTRLKYMGTQKYALDEIEKGLADDIHFFVILKGRQQGLCLAPDTNVLTADLNWIKIRDCHLGQELVAVDEYPLRNGNARAKERKMRTAKVSGVRYIYHPAYKITLHDGRVLICTGQHPWLAKTSGANQPQWRSIEKSGTAKNRKLKVGDAIKSVTTPWSGPSLEDAWFGGMLDGEGTRSTRNETGASVSVCQREGEVWERLKQYAAYRNLHPNISWDNQPERRSKFGNKPIPRLEFSRMAELFPLLARCRPTRFSNWRFWEGKSLPGKKCGNDYVEIVQIEKLPAQPMIDLETTTGTYIAEGLVSHNTTLTTALDLFWTMKYPGIQGSMVADDESNRDYFRSLIENYLKYLPNRFKVGQRLHNRNQLVFHNRSRVSYLVAGTRKKSTLGQGKGINFCHATEVASYGDVDGLHSLMASFAELHPNRLFVFESTADGLNHFYDLCQTAKTASTMKFIFIGWWRKEEYQCPRDSKEYRMYWDGRMLPEERDWLHDIKTLYGHDIIPEQLAWWRMQLHEKFQGDITMLMQEHPPTEEHAFQLTGRAFFPIDPLLDILKTGAKDAFTAFRYDLGTRFIDTLLTEDIDGELRIWEEPVEGANYVLAADPAYGSSDWADRFCIQVLRCYGDGVEQVAEYLSERGSMTGFAWIMAHLAGAYKNTTVILEVNGPGRGVLDELQKMPLTFSTDRNILPDAKSKLLDLVGSVRHYLYAKPDVLAQSRTLHWVTNQNTKPIMMNGLRDALLMGRLVVKSDRFVEEARTTIQDGSYIGGEGRAKDDSVITMAMAVQCWKQQVQPELLDTGISRDRKEADAPSAGEALVGNYLRRIMDGTLHLDN